MGKGDPLTLVQRTLLSAVSAPAVVERAEIDLGLGIGEAARITGVDIDMDIAMTASATEYGDCSVRFNPEGVSNPAEADDAFVYLRSRKQAGATPTINTSMHQYWPLEHQNLIAVKNLRITCATAALVGDAPAFNASVCVYYEKFVPNAQQLNELILYRR
ncbi:hypothetical protein ES703_123539 [subsurface metagenome]